LSSAGGHLQKLVQVQIGTFRFRDVHTKRFLPSTPLFKMVAPKVAESLADRVASLLVDCYKENENSKKGGEIDDNK